MTYTRPDIVHDAGRVSSAGARIAGCQRGNPAKLGGVGAYTYTMQTGQLVGPGECAVLVKADSLDAINATVSQVSSSLFSVRTFDLNAPALEDSAWSILILNLAF